MHLAGQLRAVTCFAGNTLLLCCCVHHDVLVLTAQCVYPAKHATSQAASPSIAVPVSMGDPVQRGILVAQ